MKNEWPIITKDTPLEEIKAIHQRIWDYVIEHGKKPETPYVSNCVACEYDDLFFLSLPGNCYFCPIIWPNGCCFSFHGNWLYSKWQKEKNPEKKTELAHQIRDLPFKYESED